MTLEEYEAVYNQFVPIDGEDNYGISPKGKVINLKTKRVLKDEIVGDGYRRIRINGHRYYIHVLVAKAFLPNPQNKKYVLHKNHNHSDNFFRNLVWSNHYIYDH